MLLAVDAGNTNVVFALVEPGAGPSDPGTVRARWRTATDPRRTADDYAAWLSPLLAIGGHERTAVTGVVIGTVVQGTLPALQALGRALFAVEPVVAGQGAAGWGAALALDRSHRLGADRALNCIAAHALHPGDAVILDFGTATTFDVIDAAGAYRGGLIAPGLNLSLDALVAAAPALPRVPVTPPESRSVIARDTAGQMRIGIYWGYLAMIEGLLARTLAEVGRPATVIATGGLAAPLAEHGQFDVLAPDLTLQGLAMLWRRAHIGRD